ncbi:MAG: alkaline phosphatase family protein [Planctomycetota bacterium]
MSSLPRSLSRFLALAVPLVLLFVAHAGVVRAQAPGRVVMLGFDGADARTLDELRRARPEAFPNVNRLAESGTFAPLLVEAPPESPVSWAALNTGQNPGKTGVPGFVKRGFMGDAPGPEMGHIKMEEVPLASVEGAPIPSWSPTVFALAFGVLAFALVFLFFRFLLRRSALLAGLLALGVAVAAAIGGVQLRALLPEMLPKSSNPNQARNFWDYAADAGKRCVVLGAVQAFDMPAPPSARVLSGLGVPDARGQIGNWFLYTSNPKESGRQPAGRPTTTSGTVYRLDDYDGELEGFVYGPKNFWLSARLNAVKDELEEEYQSPSLPVERSVELYQQLREVKAELADLDKEATSLPLEIQRDATGARVKIGDQEQRLEVGEWSEYYELTFTINPLIAVHAITRARLIQVEPHVEMFLDVLHIDPRKPPFWQPISRPTDFSAQLVAETGLYETYGWPTLTMPFKDGEIEPELLMEDVEFTLGWREDMLRSYLARDDWDCLFSVFSTTDRVQHMMYMYYDEEHPLFDAAEADKTFTFFGETIRRRDAIPKIYEQVDRVIGLALDALEPDDLFLVCSDHGFQSFRKQVHVNNWLVEEGYLALKPGLSPRQANLFGFVDWSRTKAYSLGMGFIYLNLEGREPQGIVTAAERDELLDELEAKLSAATDPENDDARFFNAVYRTEEIHSGDHVDLEGDLILGFAPPYRVSWSASAGGLYVVQDDDGLTVPGPLVTDNNQTWSGGHVSMALPDVAGVFLSNRAVTLPKTGVRSLHLAPTILNRLGVAVPAAMDLPALEVR